MRRRAKTKINGVYFTNGAIPFTILIEYTTINKYDRMNSTSITLGKAVPSLLIAETRGGKVHMVVRRGNELLLLVQSAVLAHITVSWRSLASVYKQPGE